MKRSYIYYAGFVVCAVLFLVVFTGRTVSEPTEVEVAVVQEIHPEAISFTEKFQPPKPQPESEKQYVYEYHYAPFPVKGIYVTGWVAGSEKKLDQMVDLVEETELNTMVIDVKDDTGYVSSKELDLPEVKKIGAATNKIKDLQATIEKLKNKKIYLIARIVIFKDPVLAEKRPDLAVKTSGGKVWRDYKGLAWVDPYNKEVWDYNIDIAKAAIEAGFDEVQYDYVRFPSDGNLDIAIFPGSNGLTKQENITEFIKYARFELARYEVPLSADVFGLVCSVEDGMGIGQKLEPISEWVDYVSPMVYPSHYAPGTYGFKDPNVRPYGIVNKSITDAVYKMQGKPARLRPWLQDFFKYTAKDVRAQIQATYDAGVDEWILWNSRNKYTKEALKRE